MSSPGVAAQDAVESLHASAKGPIGRDGIDKILRTTGSESAAAAWSTKKMKGRRNHDLVDPNEKNQHDLHEVFSRGSIRSARCISHFHSFSNCSEVALAAAFRAMRTIQVCSRYRSPIRWAIPRSRLRTRFRVTALPRRFVVINPSFQGPVRFSSRRYPRTRKRPLRDSPLVRTC